MKKAILFSLLAGILCTSAQETKIDSNDKTNAPVQISASEAKEHIGAQARVKGKIAEVNVGGRVTRLNFERPYPKNPFTAVIFSANINQFPEIEKLKNKTVEISGKIAAYHERPEIVLTSSNQVKIIEVMKDAPENK